MIRRLLTIWFPLLSLTVATILVGHDAVMATGPHDTGEPNAHANHRSMEPHHAAATEADHEETLCTSFEAARTDSQGRDAAPDAALSSPSLAPSGDPDPATTSCDEPDPGEPPGKLRALLQVYLI